jgi:hypothetical protein
MKTLKADGYMIQDIQGNAIFGVGETVDEAWAMVVDGAGPFFNHVGDPIPNDEAYEKQFKTYGATKALIDRVMERGGAIAWGKVRGVACTPEEEEEAENG